MEEPSEAKRLIKVVRYESRCPRLELARVNPRAVDAN
jgi:hypothetical protein